MDIAGRRFLVTGGASLIGSHLTEQLLEAGVAAVILFDNYVLGSPEVAASLAQDRRVTAVRGDITRLPELLDALDQVDGVFALAGFLTLPLSQNPGLGLDVNVLGMYNIVEACRYRGVKKVVFASSVATGRLVHEPTNASVNAHSNTSDPPRSDRRASTILLSRATSDASPTLCLPLLRLQANHRSGKVTDVEFPVVRSANFRRPTPRRSE